MTPYNCYYIFMQKFKMKVDPRGSYAQLHRWHFVLKLSPSYELAHQYRQGKITKKSFLSAVAEPDLVLQTYDDLGYTWDLSFEKWHKRSPNNFKPKNVDAVVKTIINLPNGRDVNKSKLEQAMWTTIVERENRGFPPMLLLAITLDITTAKAMILVENKLVKLKKMYNESLEDLQNRNKPKYQVRKTKLRTASIRTSINTVSTKIAHPDWPLWKVGSLLEINKDAAKAIMENEEANAKIKASGKRLNKRDNLFDLKILMNTLTSRFIKYGFLLAENAARGRFPCVDPILNADGSKASTRYDFDEFHKIYAANMHRLGIDIPEDK